MAVAIQIPGRIPREGVGRGEQLEAVGAGDHPLRVGGAIPKPGKDIQCISVCIPATVMVYTATDFVNQPGKVRFFAVTVTEESRDLTNFR